MRVRRRERRRHLWRELGAIVEGGHVCDLSTASALERPGGGRASRRRGQVLAQGVRAEVQVPDGGGWLVRRARHSNQHNQRAVRRVLDSESADQAAVVTASYAQQGQG